MQFTHCARRFPFALALVAMLCMCASAWSRAAEPVPIDDTPQIFVDDELIAAKSDVVRRVHACQKLPKPVLVSENPWEGLPDDRRVYIFGTVLYDPHTHQFQMWYNRLRNLLYATSTDGVQWKRPSLDVIRFQGSGQNNLVLQGLHSPSLVYDQRESDPAKRYKLLGYSGSYRAAYSHDGLHWKMYPKNPVLAGGDNCSLAQDPKSGEFLAFHRIYHTYRGHKRRLVYLATSRDMQQWTEPKLVMAADEIDDQQTQAEGGLWSEFYNMSVFPYAGQWLGLITHFRYSGLPEKEGPQQSKHDGPIDVQLVHSRDGRTWHRLKDRSPVIPNGPYPYDAGCILGVANGPVSVDDQLWLYYTAITTTHGGCLPEKQITVARAAWRRDGFVSLDASQKPGIVETVLLKPIGNRLTINADAAKGRITVEVLDAQGQPAPGYSRGDCLELTGDSLRHEVSWKEHSTLPPGAIRLRFHFENTHLYSYRIDAE